MMAVVTVDRSVGEFAYSPETPPRARVAPGTTLRIETRDPRSGAILVGEPGTFQAYPPPPGGKSNALTGPIYIEGAEPGDLLAIDVLAVDPLPKGYMAAGDFGWVVPEGRIGDRRIGIVAVKDGYIHWRDGMRFPARPMIGCIGTADPGNPHSGRVGPFGGNLDHLSLTGSTRIYLPVIVPGALLYVGDVHACMGDGELSCGAVEIAAAVTLTPHLVKGRAIKQPRMETAEKVITTGWDHDFKKAREMAVEDMLALMEQGMGVHPVEALMLISATGDLRIGQSCGNMEITLRLEMPKLPGLTALP